MGARFSAAKPPKEAPPADIASTPKEAPKASLPNSPLPACPEVTIPRSRAANARIVKGPLAGSGVIRSFKALLPCGFCRFTAAFR